MKVNKAVCVKQFTLNTKDVIDLLIPYGTIATLIEDKWQVYTYLISQQQLQEQFLPVLSWEDFNELNFCGDNV